MLLLPSTSLAAGRAISVPALAVARLAPPVWLEGGLASDATWQDRLTSARWSGGVPATQKKGVYRALAFTGGAPLRAVDPADQIRRTDTYSFAVVVKFSGGFGVVVTPKSSGGLGLFLDGDKHLQWHSGTGQIGAPDVALDDGKYHLVIVSVAPDSRRIRIDGVERHAAGAGAPLPADAGGKRLIIGAQDSGAFALTGSLHALLAFDSALHANAVSLAAVENTYLPRLAALNA